MAHEAAKWRPPGAAGGCGPGERRTRLVTEMDWFWLILAVFIDLGQMGGSAYANRNRMPGYATAPATY